MKKHGSAPEMGIGQFVELSTTVMREIGKLSGVIDPDEAQRFINKPRLLRLKLAQIFAQNIASSIGLEEWHKGWPRFWRHYKFQFSEEGLLLPDYYQDGFNWSIAIPQGLKNSRAFEICAGMFPSQNFLSNLDIITSCREVDKDYTVLVRDRVEADEEMRNKSATDLGDWQGFITFRERCVLEARYYAETGRHLDVDNWTLCAGSRLSDGVVPRACWFVGKFRVRWYCPVSARDSLRGRAAVS